MTSVQYRDLLNRMLSDTDTLMTFWADRQADADTVTSCLLESLTQQREYLVDMIDSLV
jgi:hypothetical protein